MSTQRSVLKDGHFRAIGRVAVEWAILELYLHIVIWGLLKVSQPVGHAVTAPVMSMNTKLHMVRSLANESKGLTTDARKHFMALMDCVSNLQTDRNNVVHAIWSVSSKPDAANRSKFTGWGQVKFINEDMTASEIEEIADNIAGLANDVLDFARDNNLNPPLS